MSDLEAIKARRAQLLAAKAQRELEAAKAAEIQAETQGLADDEALDAAEKEHGQSYRYGDGEPGKLKLATLATPYGLVILRRAEPIVWSRFTRAGKTTEKELNELVMPSLVYPTKARFFEILEEQPMTLTLAASAVAELAGARAGEVRGK